MNDTIDDIYDGWSMNIAELLGIIERITTKALPQQRGRLEKDGALGTIDYHLII